jgi:hypothetical protein
VIDILPSLEDVIAYMCDNIGCAQLVLFVQHAMLSYPMFTSTNFISILPRGALEIFSAALATISSANASSSVST